MVHTYDIRYWRGMIEDTSSLVVIHAGVRLRLVAHLTVVMMSQTDAPKGMVARWT